MTVGCNPSPTLGRLTSPKSRPIFRLRGFGKASAERALGRKQRIACAPHDRRPLKTGQHGRLAWGTLVVQRSQRGPSPAVVVFQKRYTCDKMPLGRPRVKRSTGQHIARQPPGEPLHVIPTASSTDGSWGSPRHNEFQLRCRRTGRTNCQPSVGGSVRRQPASSARKFGADFHTR
ncbi:uncharacterized protein K452DRAFT_119696 [Aplosporella prunicola CBS 121167]|uniref:Uncharacterized protein n=1 Tax=Aplosporella prunicola CBS 121167 TaxID=1176127 RepID=A0A6A6BPP0_9PEZI|nr:uncharacterized protein K452DRAFT_119696 [Aplosporella prunicola CBS 121167]KAF2145423.1 hypothetical protein K452DRAFT_119696 [Aplosporella prunicola CBS 121167]